MSKRRLATWVLTSFCALASGWAAADPIGLAPPPSTAEPPTVQGKPVLPAPPAPSTPLPALLFDAGQPPAPAVPVVIVRVRVAACAAPGQDIEYRLSVENCSPAPAHHVLLHDALPSNARFVRAVPEPTRREPELQWLLGTLEPGAHCDIVLVVAPIGTDDVKNCVRVQFEHGQCVVTRIARAAPVPGFPPVPVVPGTTAVPPVPAVRVGDAKLSLALIGPKDIPVNQSATYQIIASNPGTGRALNVLVTGFLPATAKFLSASDNGRLHAGQVAWLLGDLEPGASRTLKVVVRHQAGGEVCVKATALADPSLKAEGQVCTLVRGASAMRLEMFDTKDPIAVGGETSYLIVVFNQGYVPVTNLVIKAVVPPEMALVRASGPVDNKVVGQGKEGQLLVYEPLASLEPGGKRQYEVFVKALRPGDIRFKMEMTADQLKTGGPVHEEESTRVYQEEGATTAPPPLATPQKQLKRQP